MKLNAHFSKAYIASMKEEIQAPVHIKDGEAVFGLGANEIITLLII